MNSLNALMNSIGTELQKKGKLTYSWYQNVPTPADASVIALIRCYPCSKYLTKRLQEESKWYKEELKGLWTSNYFPTVIVSLERFYEKKYQETFGNDPAPEKQTPKWEMFAGSVDDLLIFTKNNLQLLDAIIQYQGPIGFRQAVNKRVLLINDLNFTHYLPLLNQGTFKSYKEFITTVLNPYITAPAKECHPSDRKLILLSGETKENLTHKIYLKNGSNLFPFLFDLLPTAEELNTNTRRSQAQLFPTKDFLANTKMSLSQILEYIKTSENVNWEQLSYRVLISEDRIFVASVTISLLEEIINLQGKNFLLWLLRSTTGTSEYVNWLLKKIWLSKIQSDSLEGVFESFEDSLLALVNSSSPNKATIELLLKISKEDTVSEFICENFPLVAPKSLWVACLTFWENQVKVTKEELDKRIARLQGVPAQFLQDSREELKQYEETYNQALEVMNQCRVRCLESSDVATKMRGIWRKK